VEEAVPQPPVVFWFRAYAAFMAALYALVTLAGLGLLVFYPRIAAASEGRHEAFVLLLYGALLAAMGLALGGVFLAGLLLPPRSWVWIYDIVLIAIGLSSPCCLPVSLPLLIFWVKPGTQAYFGRGAAPR
jgi:hypothetical protein